MNIDRNEDKALRMFPMLPRAIRGTSYVRQTGISADGTRWWTNVEYLDGICLGGDAHWLTPQLADRALDEYTQHKESK